jgi:type III restriction enzyme
MNYTPDSETGLLTAEYVDVYGIPFSVIPYKGRSTKKPEPEDKPKNHVRALDERKQMEMRFPVVEGYGFALRKNLIRCNVDAVEPLILEPNLEPTATFLLPTIGYREGHAAQGGGPLQFVEQTREEFYRQTHIQAIQFQIARAIVSVAQPPSTGIDKHSQARAPVPQDVNHPRGGGARPMRCSRRSPLFQSVGI